MHLKIPMNNLTAACQSPRSMAVDKAKGPPLQEMLCCQTRLFSPQSSTATIRHVSVKTYGRQQKWPHCSSQASYKFNTDSRSSKEKPQHYQGGKCVYSNVRCIYFLMSTNHTKSKCSDSLSNLHHDILPKRPSVSFCQHMTSQFCFQLEKENTSRAPVLWKTLLWLFL